MVAIKFPGVIVTFYLFVILGAFGQNFYPARYGKRDENDSYQENKRIGRRENADAFNRKMGFFISGGRFGKRGCTENCFEGDLKSGSKEIISSGYQTRQDRSERIRIPIRKNQFMMGSRFGKRMDGQTGVPGKRQELLDKINAYLNLSQIDRHTANGIRQLQKALPTPFYVLINDLNENVNRSNLKCIFTEFGDFYKCLERRQLIDLTDAIESNSMGDFLQ